MDLRSQFTKNSAKRSAWKAHMKQTYGHFQVAMTFLKYPLTCLTAEFICEKLSRSRCHLLLGIHGLGVYYYDKEVFIIVYSVSSQPTVAQYRSQSEWGAMPKRYREDSLVVYPGRSDGGWEVERVFSESLFELYCLFSFMRCSRYIVYLVIFFGRAIFLFSYAIVRVSGVSRRPRGTVSRRGLGRYVWRPQGHVVRDTGGGRKESSLDEAH